MTKWNLHTLYSYPACMCLLMLHFILSPSVSFSQSINNFREKVLVKSTDTLFIDTLTTVPNSVFIYDKNNQLIPDNQYVVNYIQSYILFADTPAVNTGDSLKITYRVFSFQINKLYKHKDIGKIEPDKNGLNNPFMYTYEKPLTDAFSYDGLNKNGSISRGISFGNNQDVVLNSSLNLQLSGKLNENLNIVAAITDQNIPLQPDGNTQQIQDFDKVYIRVFNEQHRLTAGDFELNRPESYFMNFYKKAQGGSYTGFFNVGKNYDEKPKGIMKVSTSAAISRGKYAKNVIAGIEGNQGPYRLRGSNNETFIIVIAGTERVFLDGMLMERGQQADYVIDYNTSELRFNPKRLITKDSRIVVEIEYSDKNYGRSLFYFNNEYVQDKLKLKFNLFSEQDSKNQPVLQSLTDPQKLLMKDIGDSIHHAIYPNVDSIGFDANQILYKRLDTLGYSNIYVYSTNPGNAHYRVGFSNVGPGNGDYRQINSAANGKVFEWVAPVNGLKQGSFEPLVQLITPKMQQLYTMGADYLFSKNTTLSVEGGLSNNDINLFSYKEKGNDIGKALKLEFKNTIPIRGEKEWKINSNLNYEHLDSRFIPIERYRPVEFERDWNLPTTNVNENNSRQVATIFHIDAINKNANTIGYNFKTFIKGSQYSAYQNALNTTYNWRNFRLLFNGSLLQTSGDLTNSTYLRQRADLSKKFKHIVIGAMEEQEKNSFLFSKTDQLHASSFAFNQFTGYMHNADTSRHKFRLDYVKRTDFKPSPNSFKQSTAGESFSFTTDLLINQNNRFNGSITYRKLSISDTLLTSLKPENSLLSRLEYNFTTLKGAITSSTYYEVGSGQELKKEFSFLEVAAGKGSYGWFDYNKNNVKELNEFEFVDVASFPDLAKYVKVYTPTLQYIKTYNNQLNQVLSVSPDKLFKNDSRTAVFIGRFSDQVSLRLDRKTAGEDFFKSLNPFKHSTVDENLIAINSYFRNTIYFNRSSPILGADYNWQSIQNKSLLTNGFESRDQKEHKTNVRWNINRLFTLNLSHTQGSKINKSEFFSTRDYFIKIAELEPRITFQPNTAYRISISYRWMNKENTTGGEKAVSQRIGSEFKLNSVTQGSLLFKVNYINILYNGEANNSLSYEMLEGLMAGKNLNWNVSLQRNLSSRMQLSLNYDGRKSEETNAVHTGGVQVRAYF